MLDGPYQSEDSLADVDDGTCTAAEGCQSGTRGTAGGTTEAAMSDQRRLEDLIKDDPKGLPSICQAQPLYMQQVRMVHCE